MHLSMDARSRPWAIATFGVVIWLLAAMLVRGRVHPDEIFQYLEPAHRLVFGYGVVAWEWVEGLRNWVVPGVIGGLLAAASALGAAHPWTLAFAVALSCAVWQAVGAVFLYRLVHERSGEHAATLAAVAHVTWGAFAVFAARPLGDVLSVPPLLAALLFAERARATGAIRAGLFAGLALGLAFVIRYPSAVFAIPIALSLLPRQRWSAFGALIAGGLMIFGAQVALDLSTWGFPSAWRYFTFNIGSGAVDAQFGTRPWWWHLEILPALVPLMLAYDFVRGLRRPGLTAATFGFYFVVFSAIAHKEPRFLIPLAPLFVTIAAEPAARTWERLSGSRLRVGLVLVAWAGLSIAGATIQRPFGTHTEVIDAYVAIGRDASLSGLIVAGPRWWETGGAFYLHKNVPLTYTDGMSREQAQAALENVGFSHALVGVNALEPARLDAAGFTPWRSFGRFAVWRRGTLIAHGDIR